MNDITDAGKIRKRIAQTVLGTETLNDEWAITAETAVAEAEDDDGWEAIEDGDAYCVSGRVRGGGAIGPGIVRRLVGYERWDLVRFDLDYRSRSKASGSVVWMLGDGVYVLSGFADSSRSCAPDYYCEVCVGRVRALSKADIRNLMAERYPVEAARVEAAKKQMATAEDRAEAEARAALAERLGAARVEFARLAAG